MIAAARLRHSIGIQAPAVTQDAAGQPNTTWSTFATVWAEILDITGREYIAAGGTQNQAMTKITIRYLAGVVPSMRVVWGATTYNIEAVLGTDQTALTLMCSRLAP